MWDWEGLKISEEELSKARASYHLEKRHLQEAKEKEESVEEIDHTKIMIGTVMLSIATVLMTLGY